MVEYLYSLWAEKDFEVHPSRTHPAILIPTRERALVEAMLLQDMVDEGILIESIRSYLDETESLSDLYRVCDIFGSEYRDIVEYWINEARNETFEG